MAIALNIRAATVRKRSQVLEKNSRQNKVIDIQKNLYEITDKS